MDIIAVIVLGIVLLVYLTMIRSDVNATEEAVTRLNNVMQERANNIILEIDALRKDLKGPDEDDTVDEDLVVMERLEEIGSKVDVMMRSVETVSKGMTLAVQAITEPATQEQVTEEPEKPKRRTRRKTT